MQQPTLVLDFIFFLLAAIVGGFLAHRLRQPPLLGYLITGIIFGPSALALVHRSELIQVLAEVGIALLMFTIGVHLSIRSILEIRGVALIGGAIQILLSVALGYGLGQVFGLDVVTSIFLGAVIALSSTTVVLKVLSDRAQLDTIHGRILTGILIVQDLAVVPMMVILPALGRAGGDLFGELAISTIKAAVLLGLALVLGQRVIPWALERIAATHSQELFVLSVVSMCLGTAFGAALLDLPLEIGAFIAGLVVSESEYSHEILGRIQPLRDVFAAIFFVSIGALFDVSFLVSHWQLSLALVLVILIGKFLISVAIVRGFGYSGRIAIYVGLGLAQVGEFSFVLAKTGAERNVVSEFFPAMTVAGALLTMILTPAAIQAGPAIYAVLARLPIVGRLLREPTGQPAGDQSAPASGHVIICGCDEIGQMLASILESRNFHWVGVDYNPSLVRQLQRAGKPVVYGDSSNQQILKTLGVERARLLAVTVPDPFAAELTVRIARRLNPRLDIVVRAATPESAMTLQKLGASEAVDPKLEAGLEMIRHALHRFGVSSTEAGYILSRLRQRRGETS